MNVLEKAEAVLNHRRNSYGGPVEGMQAIAAMWNAYLAARGFKEDVTPLDVTNMMALLKIVRMCQGQPQEDNHVDLIGYAAIGAMVAKVDGV